MIMPPLFLPHFRPFASPLRVELPCDCWGAGGGCRHHHWRMVMFRSSSKGGGLEAHCAMRMNKRPFHELHPNKSNERRREGNEMEISASPIMLFLCCAALLLVTFSLAAASHYRERQGSHGTNDQTGDELWGNEHIPEKKGNVLKTTQQPKTDHAERKVQWKGRASRTIILFGNVLRGVTSLKKTV